jgi:hypothetical protein
VMPPTCGTKHSGRGQYETTNLPSESDKLIFNPQTTIFLKLRFVR